MYGDCNINIERTQNGFIVRMTDPELVKQNEKRDSKSDGCCTPWHDPQVKFSFEDEAGVIKFITENIGKALPVDEYSSTFDKAVKELK